jgi:hypothetical protein
LATKFWAELHDLDLHTLDKFGSTYRTLMKEIKLVAQINQDLNEDDQRRVKNMRDMFDKVDNFLENIDLYIAQVDKIKRRSIDSDLNKKCRKLQRMKLHINDIIDSDRLWAKE